ncbi:MAG: hypothetical protein MUD11_11585 [Rhodobacteraceae bacterium]|jgi:hypothetical protein|nr:hypothetical protein [Paracoccaceae bacterium]
METSRKIEVIHPMLRRKAMRPHLTIVNALTAGAALLAVLLSVSLSAAADPEACARPIDSAIAAPCAYR